jgi:hypothetical protein
MILRTEDGVSHIARAEASRSEYIFHLCRCDHSSQPPLQVRELPVDSTPFAARASIQPNDFCGGLVGKPSLMQRYEWRH